MGSRLGVLLKTYSGWEIYYDHWAAQTVGLDIAIDGMEATYERVRCMSPMGVDDPHAWEGAPWIEGTLLIDETRKLVVWAEESEALLAWVDGRLVSRRNPWNSSGCGRRSGHHLHTPF